MSEEKRLALFTRVLAVGFLGALGFSWTLWISTRDYPLVPFFGFSETISFPFPLDYLVLGMLVSLLLALVIRPAARMVIPPLLLVLAVLFLQDLNRLWPSFYEFSFFLLVIATFGMHARDEREASRILNTLRFMLAAVYFWSGFLKFTPTFYHQTFPWFVGPLMTFVPALIPHLSVVGVIAACLEVFFAIGLLVPRLRTLALFEATAMHALIFFLIGPFRDNWNDSAWFWSLCTLAFLWVLFYKAPAFSVRRLIPERWSEPRFVPQLLAVAFLGLLPALNLLNRWPSPLSFNVYTGNVASGELTVRKNLAQKLPPSSRSFIQEVNQEYVRLDIYAWSAKEFNANPLPEKKVFKALLAYVCRDAAGPEDATLKYQEKTGWGIAPVRSIYHCDKAKSQSTN